MALPDVEEAQEGLGKLAKKVYIRREQLYSTLSRRRQPKFEADSTNPLLLT